MPTRKKQVKQESVSKRRGNVKRKTSLPKILRDIDVIDIEEGRLKETEPSVRGSTIDTVGADRNNGLISDSSEGPLAHSPSGGQQRRGIHTPLGEAYSNCRVPVVSDKGEPLMPTKASKARRLIKSGEATPFYKKGIFCVRLNTEPSDNKTQDICVGIDPGSKYEGFTVKSKKHTFLNIQTGSVDWVKREVKTRREARQRRRGRNTPYRKNRFYRNMGKNSIPASTKARWQWKLRIVDILIKIYPIESFCIENIKAFSKKNNTGWNLNFSPIQVGKSWFYDVLKSKGKFYFKSGFDTKNLRDSLGLSKTKHKSSKTFDAHCVDSWVLANSIVGGDCLDNEKVVFIEPIKLHRRRLHALQPAKGGKRRNYGGTRSMGLKRGSLVKHLKHGFTYVGGTSHNRITLHSLKTKKRVSLDTRPEHCKFLSYNTIIFHKTNK